MLEKDEREKLDKGWIQIIIIWGALFASLGVYVIVCIIMDKQGNGPTRINSQFDTLEMALYFVSLITLFFTNFIRKKMLSVKDTAVSNIFSKKISSHQHPAIAKYNIAIIITSAMSESIGIYGMVLFFIGQGFQVLYSFIIVSAAAMYYFRPKKEELLKLATQMK